MPTLILDPDLEEQLQEQRRAWGADRYDEVWDGVYVMAAMPNNEHQQLVSGLNTVYQIVVGFGGEATVLPGTNVTDQEEDWTKNYRVPDVAVYLADNPAQNKGTHWLGGPDKAVEIVSPRDRSREKFSFYESVGTRELLLVDRDPWALELHQLQGGQLLLAGRCTLEDPTSLESSVLPLTYLLVAGESRPQIQVTHRETGEQWVV